MIVVVGTLAAAAGASSVVGGPAGRTALAAAQAGAEVQVLARLGDDPRGDEVLLALAASGVGHVALLRDPAFPTPLEAAPPAAEEDDLLAPPAPEPTAATPEPTAGAPAPTLQPADVELGLRYLTHFDVAVVPEPVEPAVLAAVADAAGFAGAHLVAVVVPGSAPPLDLPERSTILEAAAGGDPDGALTRALGAYAAALDAGGDPASAFRSAQAAVGAG